MDMKMKCTCCVVIARLSLVPANPNDLGCQNATSQHKYTSTRMDIVKQETQVAPSNSNLKFDQQIRNR